MPRGILPVLARRVPPASRILPRAPPTLFQGTIHVHQPWPAQDAPRGKLLGLTPVRLAHSLTRPAIPGSIQHDANQGRTGLLGTRPMTSPLHRTRTRLSALFPPPSSILSNPYKAFQPSYVWRREVHVGRGRRIGVVGIRRAHRSSKPPPSPRKPTDEQTNEQTAKNAPGKGEATQPTDPAHPDHESITSSMSKYFHIPHMPHRPTKEELLAAANGFFERLKVRFKWVSIRSMRPWNADEWGAFVSWFILSHLVWILVGTTTFFSLLIFSINTVFAQETLAQWIGDYLTKSAGITVVFESAIVPKWKDGVIALRKVHVSRRPGQIQSSVSKGSSALAHEETIPDEEEGGHVEDDGNYTQFDLVIETVNVTLSFAKWWNGKGLLKDVEIKGVRGEVDRRSVVWEDDGRDPLSYRHEHVPGDFEVEHFKIDDLRVTVHQPEGFRPFEAAIFSCELPQLRKQWLFYDLLSANNMSGSYDGSLFTIHTPLVDNITGSESPNTFGNPDAWKKSTRLRIDNLKIDHLNRGVDGPFGWIYEGRVDIMADVLLPAEEEEGLGKVVSDFYDQLDDLVTSNRIRLLRNTIDEDRPVSNTNREPRTHIPKELIPEEDQSRDSHQDQERRYVVFDLRIRLNEVKAAVPLLTNDMSYINQALVRPIVAYINSRRTYIPVSCRFAKRRSDFEGSWSVFDSGLMNDLSAETYSAFALNVEDQQNRVRRLKKVGGWTLSLLIHAVAGGMAGAFA